MAGGRKLDSPRGRETAGEGERTGAGEATACWERERRREEERKTKKRFTSSYACNQENICIFFYRCLKLKFIGNVLLMTCYQFSNVSLTCHYLVTCEVLHVTKIFRE
jgi:hypothetical protein